MNLEELRNSEKDVGQLLPVLKNADGEIIDGFHRKRVNPEWQELILSVAKGLDTLKARVHLNVLRRDIPINEKDEWIQECRRLLQANGSKGTQEEIAKELSMSRQWVSKYDANPYQAQDHSKVLRCGTFWGYNVWGFKDEDWRKQIIPADSKQPDVEFYHGATPAFVIHQLVKMFEPKIVLDSMAGTGTTGYVCKQYGIECDLFDLYPYEKFSVLQGDAEFIDTGKTYDLIFNHIPYWQMVAYGDSSEDLSSLGEVDFKDKLRRIIAHNYQLLSGGGVYAILVGDWRHGGKIVPLTAMATLIGLNSGFTLYDEAIKLTGEMKGKTLQEYRAAKGGYLAQTYDAVLIFKRI